MKNQYVGDIGDYGKYSLLRFLALHGIRVGVNWYLTDNDGSSDGKFTDYLKKETERASTMQAKNYYASFKKMKTGFASPTIGTIYPKGSTVQYNDNGTITIVPP